MSILPKTHNVISIEIAMNKKQKEIAMTAEWINQIWSVLIVEYY